jgi:hypothetical protein
MECTGRILNIAIGYGTGKPVLALEMDGDMNALFPAIEELKAADKLTIKMSKFKEKRSLDANAYCWVLLGRLAEKLKTPKTEIYRSVIKEIGGNSDTVCVQDKAVESLRDGWQRNGIGWVTDTMPSKIDGCTNVILYYGSSTYDKAQMSRLINAIVEECKLQGIETRSQEELASLLNSWR